MRHMKIALEDLDIGYRMPLQPVSFHPASPAEPHRDSSSSGLGRFGSFTHTLPRMSAPVGRY